MSATEHIMDRTKTLLLDEDQKVDVTLDLLAIIADHDTTADEWNLLRQMPCVKQGKTVWGDGIRKGLAKLRSVSAHIFLPALPESGTTQANTKLEFAWCNRLDEDERLKRIHEHFGGFAKVPDLAVVDHSASGLPSLQIAVEVSPVDAILWLDLDPEEFLKDKPNEKAVERYTALGRHLSQIPGLKLGSYFEQAVARDGARPHPDCIRGWLRLKTDQKAGGVLTVRRMPTNPATWFQVDETVYSIAPMHTVKLVNDIPAGNKLKQVQTGDLITVTSFLIGEPHIQEQIAAGTCPRIDVVGTMLRSGGEFSRCPNVGRSDQSAVLVDYWAADAIENCGTFCCAGE